MERAYSPCSYFVLNVPGALPRAGMESRLRRSCQTFEKEITCWRPPPRAGGPIHTSPAQQARYGSGNTPEGRRPDSYQPGATRQSRSGNAPEGRRPDSYQPGATRQVQERQYPRGPEARLHTSLAQRARYQERQYPPRAGGPIHTSGDAPVQKRQAPRAGGPIHTSLARRAGTGAATPLRAGGPIHTSLAQRARCRSGNTPEGRRPDSYQPRRNAPGAGAATPPRAEGPIHTSLAQRARYRSGNTPEGRRPDSYQPGATRQVQERQCSRGPEPDSYQPGRRARCERQCSGPEADSYQPGATRQVERQYPRGLKARFIPAWRNAPGAGAAIPRRAGGPIHTSLARRARCRSGNTRKAHHTSWRTRQVQERQYPEGEGPIHTSLARRARCRSGNTPEGRRPDSYQPSATRQVGNDPRAEGPIHTSLAQRARSRRQCSRGPKARFIPAWRNKPGAGTATPEGRRPDSYQPGATRQVQERQYPGGPKARFIPAWRNAPGAGAATPPRAEGPTH